MSKTVATREFTGRHMLLVTVAFFGVIVGVNVTMAIFASSTWTGLVVQNSYVASQEFNDKEAARAAQAAAGWQPVLTYGQGAASLVVTDAAGRPVALGEVSLEVSRPVGVRGDRLLTLAPMPDGSYRAPLVLEPGVWNVVVTAPATAAGPFELHERFVTGSASP